MSTKLPLHVEVSPREEYERRPRLFRALEEAFPVRFHAPGAGTPDAAVAFATGLAAEPAEGQPTLLVVTGERRLGVIELGDSPLLPRAVRGRSLGETSAAAGTLEEWGDVLASADDGPVWCGRAELQYAAASWPAELEPGDTLRQQLTAGRFIGLLPLAHFLRELCIRASWRPAESKACFVFDDPNLHWWTYGYLDYRALSAHADAHDYSVTVATIPIDQWYVHRRTARFLSQHGRITFAVHGNDHTSQELRRVRDPDRAAAIAAQALARSAAARRAGTEIAPVMVPPHGVASLAGLEGCLRAGFEAMCADWPYWWLSEDGGASPLSGWQPLDRLAGLPVIPRAHAVASDPDDIVFRAFLGQPLILYGHHTDLKDGLGVLADRAAGVRSLGVDTWQPLGRIARDAVSSHRAGDMLAATLFSRRTTLSIPEGVSTVVLALAGSDPQATEVTLELQDDAGRREARTGEQLPVQPGEIVVTMIPASAPPARRSRWQPRAAARRVLTEGRDRVAPVLRRG